MEIYETIGALIIGVMLCFFGYKLKRIAFSIIWFIIGYHLTCWLLSASGANLSVSLGLDDLWTKILPFAIGLLLSIIGLSIEKLCVSAFCFFAVILTVIDYMGFSQASVIIGIIAGVIVGCIAVACMKPAIIVGSALIGSRLLSQCIASLLLGVINYDLATYGIVIVIIMTIIGSLFQFKNTRNIE